MKEPRPGRAKWAVGGKGRQEGGLRLSSSSRGLRKWVWIDTASTDGCRGAERSSWGDEEVAWGQAERRLVWDT